jgi:hypothetical protein
MVNRILLTLLVTCIAHGICLSQNASEDIRKINGTLADGDLTITLAYVVYPDSLSMKPLQSEQGKWIKSDKSQYYALGQIETVRKAGELQVVLDHANKIVTIADAPVLPEDENMMAAFMSLDMVLEESIAIRYKNLDKGRARWDIYPRESEFDRIAVVFDKKTYAPEKMILYSAAAETFDQEDGAIAVLPRIEIEFKSMRKNTSVPAELDLSKYVSKRGGKYELSAAFKEYELNNHLLTN